MSYCLSDWWSFTKALERKRIDNFIRRCLKSGFCPADIQSLGDLCLKTKDKLFNHVLNTFYVSFLRKSLLQSSYNLRGSDHAKTKEISNKLQNNTYDGLWDAALQTVYQAVVVARLLYAASAWWGFITAADRQRIEGFLHGGVRAGYRLADAPIAAQLVEEMDDQLFHRVRYVSGHVLHSLLPSRRSESYSLRERRHDYQLLVM